ncbi:MAG: baseplate J/gp47 family protein, partial [Sarcina sp.]
NKYNVLANMINQLPVKLVGVSKVYNKNNIVDGRDTEDDKSLYNRLKLKVSKPATSGNIYNYEYWALEVSGVGFAIVKPIWNGNGTVKVILVGTDGRKPNQQIINDAKEHIKKNRPIGASVTVVGVNELSIQVRTNVILEKDTILENVKNKFIENINNYLQEVALKDNIIRYNKISSCLLNVPSVVDYKSLTVNNGYSDITLTNDSIAVLGSVVVDSVR